MKKLAALVVAVAIAGWSAVALADVKAGADLFGKKMCAACHGKDGGGGPAGPSLKGIKKNKAEIIAFLKAGSAKMKPVKATDAELGDLADHVLTLK